MGTFDDVCPKYGQLQRGPSLYLVQDRDGDDGAGRVTLVAVPEKVVTKRDSTPSDSDWSAFYQPGS